MTKILLIDDDVELLSLLGEYLESEGFEVGKAHDGEAGAKAALTGDYDLAVLDVTMPRLNGVEALRRIRADTSLPVLMLTARGDDADRIVGLELGADDYVPKPCTPRELTARIRAILRRTSGVFAEDITAPISAAQVVVWPAQRRAELAGQPLELTGTEYNLLEVLVRNAGRPVAKERLSELALGRSLERFDRSIDVHVSSLRRKLGALPGGRSCIQTVYRQGYQFILG